MVSLLTSQVLLHLWQVAAFPEAAKVAVGAESTKLFGKQR